MKRLFFFFSFFFSFFLRTSFLTRKVQSTERRNLCVSRTSRISIQTGGSNSFENAMPNEAFASCRALFADPLLLLETSRTILLCFWLRLKTDILPQRQLRLYFVKLVDEMCYCFQPSLVEF